MPQKPADWSKYGHLNANRPQSSALTALPHTTYPAKTLQQHLFAIAQLLLFKSIQIDLMVASDAAEVGWLVKVWSSEC